MSALRFVSRPSFAGLVLAGLCAGLAAGCASAGRPVPSGAQVMAVAGPTMSSFEMKPSVCIAGQHFVFWGADLVEEKTGLTVRLVIDPLSGPAVRVMRFNDLEAPSFVVGRANCRKLKADVKRVGSMINGIDVVKVDLDLDCATTDGDSVVGKVSTDECR